MKKISIKTWISLFVLSASFVAIYSLYFLVSNYYDLMKIATGLTHQQLGNLVTAYGIVSLFCYIPGGILADKVKANILLAISLISTGFIAIYISTFPSYTGMLVAFSLTGVTCILTYWPAFIKAISMLGDSSQQGRLFGFWEGFSGVLGTLLGLAGVYMINRYIGEVASFKAIVLSRGIFLIVTGVIVYFMLNNVSSKKEDGNEILTIPQLLSVAKLPNTWLIGGIVAATYITFSALAYTAPYMTEYFGVSISMTSIINTLRIYFVGLFIAPLAGIVVDKQKTSFKVCYISFIACIIGYLSFMVIPRSNASFPVMLIVFVALAITVFVFALRGINYAIVDEVKVSAKHYGAVIGFASLVGYSSDAYLYTLAGGWIDKYGLTGYMYIFVFMTLWSIVGLTLSIILKRRTYNKKNKIV